MGAGPEVTQPLLAESKEDASACQSDTLAHEDGLEDHSAGLDPPPVDGSDVAHHVPFHPAMRNDEYDKGARSDCSTDFPASAMVQNAVSQRVSQSVLVSIVMFAGL